MLRRRTLRHDEIVFNGRRSSSAPPCVSVAGGALLVLPTIAGTPPGFEICIDGSYHSARVVWRSTTNLGVAWFASPNKKPR